MLDLCLDHVGAIVTNLDTGAERWRRLGFQLSPRSPQMGFDKATGRIQPWATSNHCAALRRGYLELIGVTQPELPNPWRHFTDRFEGVHITALRCPDADRAYAEISRRCDGLDPPVDRRRQVLYRSGHREMRFRNIFSRDDSFPEGRFIVIEHQTPELIWQEELMEHPNGALALEDVQFVASVPEPTVTRIAGITGLVPDRTAQGSPRFQLPGGGAIEVLTAEEWSARFPGCSPPPAPAVGACTISVRDLSTARRTIGAAGIEPEFSRRASFSVAPDDANGVRLVFEESR